MKKKNGKKLYNIYISVNKLKRKKLLLYFLTFLYNQNK